MPRQVQAKNRSSKTGLFVNPTGMLPQESGIDLVIQEFPALLLADEIVVVSDPSILAPNRRLVTKFFELTLDNQPMLFELFKKWLFRVVVEGLHRGSLQIPVRQRR